MSAQELFFLTIYFVLIVLLGNFISWLIKVMIGYHLEKKDYERYQKERTSEVERIVEDVYSNYMEAHGHEMTEEDKKEVEAFRASLLTKRDRGPSL